MSSSGSPLRQFTKLPSPPPTVQRKRTWEQGFPVKAFPTEYPASHPDAGQPAGYYWVGNPTAKFNKKGEGGFNNNKALHEQMASVKLQGDMKSVPASPSHA